MWFPCITCCCQRGHFVLNEKVMSSYLHYISNSKNCRRNARNYQGQIRMDQLVSSPRGSLACVVYKFRFSHCQYTRVSVVVNHFQMCQPYVTVVSYKSAVQRVSSRHVQTNRGNIIDNSSLYQKKV